MTPKEFIELYEKQNSDNIVGSTLKVNKSMSWLDKYNLPKKDYQRNLAFDIYKYFVCTEEEFDIAKAIEDLHCEEDDFMHEFYRLIESGYIKLDIKIKEQEDE